MSSTLKYHCLLVGALLYNEFSASAFSPSSFQPSKNTCLYQSRSNERAHMEKEWENMMDNDWREFRASLIAKEKADEVAAEKMKTKTKVGAGSLDAPPKEDKLGDIISGAFTSFFKGGKDEEKHMFKGNVGGANSKTQFTSIDFPSECEDPFLSVEECHILYSDADKVKINKHRWAHPLSHVEPGCVLVANEKLGGVFHQTVVLIIDHDEKIGSTGMIINRCVR
jgi:putative transcriptional regulator